MIKVHLILFMIALPWLARAELGVMADYGGRSSGVPDFKAISAKQGQALSRIPRYIRRPIIDQSTTILRSGRLKTQTHHHDRLTQPIFIVGTDEVSKKWLIANEAYLSSINAQGFISSSHRPDVIDAMNQLTALSIVATNTNALADLFQLSHYPVLITQKEITQ